MPIRRPRDVHKLSGLRNILLLFVLVTTGVLLALPAVMHALLVPAAIPAPKLASEGKRQVSIVHSFAVAHRVLPDGRIVFIDMPGTGDASIRVRLQVPGHPHRRFPGSYVFSDQFSGRVLAVHDVRRVGAGSTLAGWIRTLHDGTVGGMATRLLAVLIGFVPTILFASRLVHWLRRNRARRTSLPVLDKR